MTTLGLIPARAGSKGIPGKNIKLIAGKPLIAWTITAALNSRELDVVVVSTEDDAIADIARRWGAQVPFMRPRELALDTTSGVDPVFHALGHMPEVDAVVLLQPTSPLRTAQDIDQCISLARELQAESVIAVVEAEQHPHWMYRVDLNHRMRPLIDAQPAVTRQELPSVYAVNGAVYYAGVDSLKQHRTFVTPDSVAYVMPPERSVDIDTLLDWKLAELLLEEQC